MRRRRSFPTKLSFREWAESADYQRISEDRRAGADTVVVARASTVEARPRPIRSSGDDDRQLVASTFHPHSRAPSDPATCAASSGSDLVVARARASRPLCALLKWLTTVRRPSACSATTSTLDGAGQPAEGRVGTRSQIDDQLVGGELGQHGFEQWSPARGQGRLSRQFRRRGEPVCGHRVVGAQQPEQRGTDREPGPGAGGRGAAQGFDVERVVQHAGIAADRGQRRGAAQRRVALDLGVLRRRDAQCTPTGRSIAGQLDQLVDERGTQRSKRRRAERLQRQRRPVTADVFGFRRRQQHDHRRDASRVAGRSPTRAGSGRRSDIRGDGANGSSAGGGGANGSAGGGGGAITGSGAGGGAIGASCAISTIGASGAGGGGTISGGGGRNGSPAAGIASGAGGTSSGAIGRNMWWLNCLWKAPPPPILHAAAFTGGDGRSIGQRRGRVAAVPADVESTGLRPVLEAACEKSLLDIAGVEPIAIDRSASCRISHPRHQARAVRPPGRVPAGDVRRARNRVHERQQRYGSKHAAGRY